jgi:AraC-like DNA-binding protein
MLEKHTGRIEDVRLSPLGPPTRYLPLPAPPIEPAPARHLERAIQELLTDAQEELRRLRRIVRGAGHDLILYVGTHQQGRMIKAESDRGAFPGDDAALDEDGAYDFRPDASPRAGCADLVVHRISRRYPSTATPIFDPDGTVIAALGISSMEQERATAALGLARSVALTTAHAIEERLFRKRHHGAWIVAVRSEDVTLPGMLLAIDANQRIVAADRHARKTFAIDCSSGSATLWTIFAKDTAPFRRSEVEDWAVCFIGCATGERWPALVTPPASASNTWCSPYAASMRFRPRLDAVDCSPSSGAPAYVSGGLSAGALRRVRAYVDAHLEGAIDLRTLSGIAGLSTWHFARAFKKCLGMTPHTYLMRRRLEHAQHLLTQSAIPVAEIAVLSGFCDQSHLCRAFRQHVGVSPLAFRRAAN